MMGYYNLHEATRQTIVEGWLKTGDLGCLDEEWLFVCSGPKKGNAVVSWHEYLSKEIEEVLQGHPAQSLFRGAEK